MYSEVFTCSLSDGSVEFLPVSAATALLTYDDMLHSIQQGSTIRASMSTASCDVSTGNPQFDAFGFKIGTAESFDDAAFGPPSLVSTTSSLVQDDDLWVTRHVKSKFLPNSSIEMSIVYLDPSTLQPNGSEPVQMLCDTPTISASVVQPSVLGQITLFRTFILGQFSNQAQVSKPGDDPPFALHIAGVGDSKIIGVPPGFYNDGRFWDLEESYYTTPKGTTASPFLFLFSPNANGTVRITAYDPPSSIAPEDLRNNNTDLVIKFMDLTVSSTFTPASYKYVASCNCFRLGPVATPIQGGSFVLTETIAKDVLTVMEDVVINGSSVMPYSTPIVYDRIA